MEQVIQNLLLNAKEAMPGGGTVNIKIENYVIDNVLLPLLKGNYIKVTVKDNGPGVEKTILPSIFDPYFTTKEMGSKKGTGLGLAICHSIIKQHDGVILADSEIGKGTTFEIYLPVYHEKDVEKIEPVNVIGSVAPKGKGRVLLMDDDEAVLNVGGEMLIYLGYDVACAKEGEEAIFLFHRAMESENSFDAVILDLSIRGGLGGEKTIGRLRQQYPEVVAIVASGYTDDPVMANCEKYGFKAVVHKPFSLTSLQTALDQARNWN